MKELKIGYISDEHIDFYVYDNNPQSMKRKIANYIEKQLKPEGGDILLCAGDTSHYNNQVKEYLIQMQEFYTHICIVPGNHDMYLINDSQKSKYKKRSESRRDEIQEFCETETNIHYLDGNVICIDGVKIGGYGNWYNLDSDGKIEQWNEVMRDAELIIDDLEPISFNYGYGGSFTKSRWDTQAYRKKHELALDRIIEEKCDILLCHIVPMIIPEEIVSDKFDSSNDMFYMTDDIEKLEATEAKVVIYGHDHTNKEWKHKAIDFKTNALGYPGEHCATKIQHFKYTKV